MKRNLIRTLLIAVCFLLPTMFMLSACGETPDYKITFEENGGSIVNDLTYKENDKIVEPTQPTKLGYNFKGWQDVNGEPFVFDTMPAENITLYASWEIVNYSITYNLNGGVVSEENPQTYNIEDASITLNNPTKTGSTFVGWIGTDITTPAMNVTISSGSTGNREYTAIFSENSFTVSFNSNNADYGTINISELENVKYNSIIEINENNLTINNQTVTATPNNKDAQYTYVFDGWYIEEQKINSGYVVTFNTNIQARFNAVINKYNVAIEVNYEEYGTVSSDILENIPYGSQITVNNEQGTITVNNETVTATPTTSTAQYNYNFSHFEINNEELANGETVDGNLTIVAIFERVVATYSTNFQANNTNLGSVIVSDNNLASKTPYGSVISYDNNVLTITFPDDTSYTCTATPNSANSQYSYNFVEWKLQDGEIVSGETKITGETTITAVFERQVQTYDITFAYENGTTIEQDNSVEYGTKVSFNGKTPTKEATESTVYTFIGWTKDLSTKEIVNLENETVTGNTTYYAVFNESTRKYNVAIEVNNSEYGTVNKTEFEIEYNSTINYDVLGDGTSTLWFNSDATNSVIATPEIATAQYKYTFSKWLFNGQEFASNGAKITANATITAVFERELLSYSVVWLGFNGEDYITLRTDTSVEYGTQPVYNDLDNTLNTMWEGYIFIGWAEKNSDGTFGEVYANNELPVITKNVTYYAQFEIQKFSIETNVNSTGFGTVNSYSGQVNYNTEISFNNNTISPLNITASANSGYAFSHWLVNDKSYKSETTMVITENITITAVFYKLITVNVQSDNSDYGYIEGETSFTNCLKNGIVAFENNTAKYNNLTATAVANQGYVFSHWLINEEIYNNINNAYAICEDITIKAVFVAESENEIKTLTKQDIVNVMESIYSSLTINTQSNTNDDFIDVTTESQMGSIKSLALLVKNICQNEEFVLTNDAFTFVIKNIDGYNNNGLFKMQIQYLNGFTSVRLIMTDNLENPSYYDFINYYINYNYDTSTLTSFTAEEYYNLTTSTSFDYYKFTENSLKMLNSNSITYDKYFAEASTKTTAFLNQEYQNTNYDFTNAISI